MLLARRQAQELLEQLGLSGQMQLFPIAVEGQAEPYYLLNLLRIVRCIDDARCEEVAYRNIIVSEQVKRAMEESGMTGARFTEV